MNLWKIITNVAMLVQLLFLIVSFDVSVALPKPQDQPAFELPVELVGFPVIIMAVRISNFVRKLAYSLSPRTYARSRREIIDIASEEINIAIVERKLISEFGKDVCIYEDICIENAIKAKHDRGKAHDLPTWDDIFSHYNSTPNKNKDFYLLSVFLGDIVASPQLCKSLASKEHRACKN